MQACKRRTGDRRVEPQEACNTTPISGIQMIVVSYSVFGVLIPTNNIQSEPDLGMPHPILQRARKLDVRGTITTCKSIQ